MQCPFKGCAPIGVIKCSLKIRIPFVSFAMLILAACQPAISSSNYAPTITTVEAVIQRFPELQNCSSAGSTKSIRDSGNFQLWATERFDDSYAEFLMKGPDKRCILSVNHQWPIANDGTRMSVRPQLFRAIDVSAPIPGFEIDGQYFLPFTFWPDAGKSLAVERIETCEASGEPRLLCVSKAKEWFESNAISLSFRSNNLSKSITILADGQAIY